MKIAVFVGETFCGGVGSCMLNYFRHIDVKRFQFVFLVGAQPADSLQSEIAERGGRVVVIPPRRRILTYLWAVFRELRSGRYDAVHANLTTLNFMPLFAAWLARVPMRISHSHSNSNPADRGLNLIKNALRHLSHLFVTDYFTCSEKSGRWLFGDAFSDSGRVRLIRNAIDVSRFAYDERKRQAVRDRYGLQGRFVVGNISRFTTQKNHPFVLSVFAQIVCQDPSARLLYVGWGELEHEVRKMVAEMGLDPYVIFAGTAADASAYYSAMDVFLLPSLFEGLCVCLVEAQANGLPCVVSTNNSEESKLTPWLSFHSLEEPVEAWARACLSSKRPDDHSAPPLLLKAAGYDIIEEVRFLESNYMKEELKCR